MRNRSLDLSCPSSPSTEPLSMAPSPVHALSADSTSYSSSSSSPSSVSVSTAGPPPLPSSSSLSSSSSKRSLTQASTPVSTESSPTPTSSSSTPENTGDVNIAMLSQNLASISVGSSISYGGKPRGFSAPPPQSGKVPQLPKRRSVHMRTSTEIGHSHAQRERERETVSPPGDWCCRLCSLPLFLSATRRLAISSGVRPDTCCA